MERAAVLIGVNQTGTLPPLAAAVSGAVAMEQWALAQGMERDLVKLKLLTHLSERLGLEMEAIITGVADYGFFAQAETLPVEGMVHVSTLADDYYYYEEATHSLTGRRGGQRYRLGDKVRVVVARVDLQRRQLDFRVADRRGEERPPEEKPRRKRRRE